MEAVTCPLSLSEEDTDPEPYVLSLAQRTLTGEVGLEHECREPGRCDGLSQVQSPGRESLRRLGACVRAMATMSGCGHTHLVTNASSKGARALGK